MDALEAENTETAASSQALVTSAQNHHSSAGADEPMAREESETER